MENDTQTDSAGSSGRHDDCLIFIRLCHEKGLRQVGGLSVFHRQASRQVCCPRVDFLAGEDEGMISKREFADNHGLPWVILAINILILLLLLFYF